MQEQFLNKFYDELISLQLNNLQDAQPLFYYIEVMDKVCKKIHLVCNNSKLSITAFCTYLINNLIFFEQEAPLNPSHELLKSLKVEQNHIVFLTQIFMRMLLINYLFKINEEKKIKQWRICFSKLLKDGQIQFMFNYHQSLATVLAISLKKVRETCNQLSFYEYMVSIFEQNDFQYVARQIRIMMKQKKQDFKNMMVKKKQEFICSGKGTEKKPENSEKERSSLSKKSIKNQKVTNMEKKQSVEDHVKNRMSDFRQSQKKRLSMRDENLRRRTIFQSRRFIVKSNSSNDDHFRQSELHTQQQFQRYQKELQVIQRENLSKPQNRQEQKVSKSVKKSKAQVEKIVYEEVCDETMFVPGTPPKKL